MINCLLFSFNRAMQLDAVLRSFFTHCQEAEQIKITILYKTTNDQHAQQYRTLIREFVGRDNIKFFSQNKFRQDVLALMNPLPDSSIKNRFYNFILQLDQKSAKLFTYFLPISKINRHILFLVDDNIFIRDFNMNEVTNSLRTNPDAIGFSLRLSINTTYCYTLNKPQITPKFINVSENILEFDWTNGDADFGYPLEISSSVYRLRDILPIIFSIPFENPNTLEGQLAIKTKILREKYPNLLCFENSVAFCNPVNKIQDVNDNLFGNRFNYSCDELAQLFDEGYRIDINSYNNFVPNACHQEVELIFKKYAN